MAFAVEKEQCGYRADVAEGPSDFGRAHRPEKRQSKLSGELANVVFLRLDGEREDFEGVTVTFFHIAEPAQRSAAGRAPGRPELHEHHFSKKIFTRDPTA